MRSTLLLAALLGLLVLRPGSALAAAQIKVCNKGDMIINAVVAEFRLLFGHMVGGWPNIRPGECTEIWRTGSNVWEKVYIDFSKPGPDKKLGVYLVGPSGDREQNDGLRSDRTDRVFCVNPTKGFSRTAGSYDALGPKCTGALRPMAFSLAVQIRRKIFTINVTPKKNSPVISFDGTGSGSTVSQVLQESRKIAADAKALASEMERSLESTMIAEGTMEAQVCDDLDHILADEENDFKNLQKKRIRAHSGAKASFTTSRKLSGFDECLIHDKGSYNQYFCIRNKENIDETRKMMRGFGKMISACTHAKPKYHKGEDIQFYTFAPKDHADREIILSIFEDNIIFDIREK